MPRFLTQGFATAILTGFAVSVARSLLTSKGSHSPPQQHWAARSFQSQVWVDIRNFQ